MDAARCLRTYIMCASLYLLNTSIYLHIKENLLLSFRSRFVYKMGAMDRSGFFWKFGGGSAAWAGFLFNSMLVELVIVVFGILRGVVILFVFHLDLGVC